jgi:DNA-binding PucR family transcriptional regulator
VIVPASAVPDAGALVQVLRECSPFTTVSLRAGVSSRKAEPDLLAEGLREARIALTAAAGSARAAVLFDDLGVLQFLLGSGGALELDDYARRVLGPLVDYDARHDARLVATLDAYLANGCNASRTARAINLHLKSVQYRLRRISEICGLDLGDRETRLDAELALRIIGPARTLRSALGHGPEARP